jgi:bacterioferritin-associated ferredoxin
MAPEQPACRPCHRCTCHDIDVADFRAARDAGAATVKECFRKIGRMPKCANCVPMIRKVLAEIQP